MNPQLFDALKLLAVGAGALIMALVGFFVGRKSKHDDIQIGKRHSFAEGLSVLLQKDFQNRQQLAEGFRLNFSNEVTISEAIKAFHKHQSSFSGMRTTMQEVQSDVTELEALNRQAAIYMGEKTTRIIDEYISATRFAYATDGVGLINDFDERFFENLLEKKRAKQLGEAFKKSMKGLRKAIG